MHCDVTTRCIPKHSRDVSKDVVCGLSPCRHLKMSPTWKTIRSGKRHALRNTPGGKIRASSVPVYHCRTKRTGLFEAESESYDEVLSVFGNEARIDQAVAILMGRSDTAGGEFWAHRSQWTSHLSFTRYGLVGKQCRFSLLIQAPFYRATTNVSVLPSTPSLK